MQRNRISSIQLPFYISSQCAFLVFIYLSIISPSIFCACILSVYNFIAASLQIQNLFEIHSKK